MIEDTVVRQNEAGDVAIDVKTIRDVKRPLLRGPDDRMYNRYRFPRLWLWGGVLLLIYQKLVLLILMDVQVGLNESATDAELYCEVVSSLSVRLSTYDLTIHNRAR